MFPQQEQRPVLPRSLRASSALIPVSVPPQHLLLPVLNQWSSSSLLHLLHLRLFCLLRHLLPHRSGLECGDRKWSAGVGADGPGRAPSPHFSMLDSESDGEEREREGAGEG